TTKLVADRLKDEYPERKIFVIDSLCASLGQGLFIYYCINMKKEGKTITEIATWAEKNKLHVCHNFTVDDLNHLYRGGRVSKVSAVMGTLLGIKPVLHVDNEGKLVPLAKVRGRRQSLDALVDLMEKKIQNYNFDNKIFFISHGDSLEDAQYVQEQVTKRFKIKDCLISPVGPVIGTHSGPGTIALFFIGDER
ncbi:MAG: DegV family protein, partial [Oscillospiraceae bacterium]